MTARLYIEGGGDRREQQALLRQAFAKLLETAGFGRPNAPTVICAGSRNHSHREFCNALRVHGDATLLLVDAEAPVEQEPWDHVRDRDGWVRPEAASDDHLHFMIEMMENWLLCDRAMLAAYFGSGFVANHLPGRENDVESIAKARVAHGLRMATRNSKKGEYRKGAHSADLLGSLDAERLRRSAPCFARLIDALNTRRAPTRR